MKVNVFSALLTTADMIELSSCLGWRDYAQDKQLSDRNAVVLVERFYSDQAMMAVEKGNPFIVIVHNFSH